MSHKIPVIKRYIQEMSFSQISRSFGGHGVGSMARYLHHFALVMILNDRGLSTAQMQSVISTSANLIEQYLQLHVELDRPEHQLANDRLKRLILNL